MINKIIAFSINNKLVVGLFTLAMIGLGIWSMTRVPLDAVPDITNNQVQVITQSPNLGTVDIEQFVTYPVEISMSNLPGVQEIRSISRFGLSVVTIVFDDDLGTYLPRQLVSEKLREVQDKIPSGFGKPSMGPISTGLSEIYQYTLEVDSNHIQQYTATDLRTIQDWIIGRQMAMVPGVIEVNGFGGNIKQYEVAVKPDDLKAIGLTIADIFTALKKNNQNTGGAYIEKDHYANFIRGEGLARNIRDIENIVVSNQNGLPIAIKDVAEVQFGRAVRYGAFTKDGHGEAVGGMILMLKGANSNEVIAAVKERMEAIQKSLPEGITIQPFLDRSELIADTTSTVSENLIEGALIVIFVLVFLLGNWRGGVIVASTIPLSLLFAFILMNAFDVWANLMSLGAIDFGIIVDGAVIIVEGTVFFLYQKIKKGQTLTQDQKDDVAYTASTKMMNSAFFGQLIILIVFVPILALEGVEGKMFKPMALTFMFAMIGVMILCLTYVPMMSAWLVRVNHSEKKSWGDRLVQRLENFYEPILQKALRYTKWVIGLAVVALGSAVFTFSRLGGEFIPQLDEGDIAFHIILKPGSSLSESIQTSTKIEKILLDNFPEIEHAMSRFGVAEVPTDPMPMDIGDCFIILKPKSEWVSADSKEALIEKIKAALSVVPGVSYEFTQPIEMRFNELLTGVREDIAIKLYGEDLEVLASKIDEIGSIISTVPGVGDMRVEATSGLPQMTIQYDRYKLAQHGLNIEHLNTAVQTAFAGGKAGVIFEGEKRFDLVVRLDEAYRKSIDDLKNLYVNLPNGSQIPLQEVAEINYEPGPMQISRDNTNRRVYAGINVRGRDVKTLVEEIQNKLDTQLELPPGYYIRYGGAFENLERATNRLQVVVPIALGLIFMLIFFALQSIKQSVMIYIAIPMAAIGGVFSLWIRDMPFSISAGVGFIVLFGVAVLNGLVLISGWNELKEEGMHDLNERISLGAKRRIRPILLTALTDVLGFLPMAISSSAGAEVQRPLATVVIGGMISATLLTLFVLPILYRWAESRGDNSFSLPTPPIILLLMVAFSYISHPAIAQNEPDSLISISMDDAVQRAKKVYPKIKAAQLEVEGQQALKKTSWDMGRTQLFTGGEEIGGNGQGIHTILGIQQQNIDLFSVPTKRKLQEEKVALADAALQLTEREIEYQVKLSYGRLFVAKKRLKLYQKLDSVFQEFERAAKLRYETEATSKLAYLAAANQAKQLLIQKNQEARNYDIASQQFNLWMVSDSIFSTTNLAPFSGDDSPTNRLAPVDNHPMLQMSRQQMEVAEKELKKAKSGLLPTFNIQYGWQEANGKTGFYQYQAGINIPLFFMQDQGNIQVAKVHQLQADHNAQQTKMELESEYSQSLQSYLKWKESWQYYQTEALDLARQQRQGALLAYREGAIDYVTFLQNVKDAMQIEIGALDALEMYLKSRSQLEYFINL